MKTKLSIVFFTAILLTIVGCKDTKTNRSISPSLPQISNESIHCDRTDSYYIVVSKQNKSIYVCNNNKILLSDIITGIGVGVDQTPEDPNGQFLLANYTDSYMRLPSKKHLEFVDELEGRGEPFPEIVKKGKYPELERPILQNPNANFGKMIYLNGEPQTIQPIYLNSFEMNSYMHSNVVLTFGFNSKTGIFCAIHDDLFLTEEEPNSPQDLTQTQCCITIKKSFSKQLGLLVDKGFINEMSKLYIV
ncbi:MAG: hypothetical protein ACRCXZ_08130 [Patescibacteria group bacterium]